MTLSPEEMATKIMALPEPVQDQVLNFIEFMLEKTAKQTLISTADSQSDAEIKQPVQLAGPDVVSSWTTDK